MNENIPTIEPSRTMLLVMDYQAGIIGMVPAASETLPAIAETIAMARHAGMHIGYVRVAFTDADYEAVPSTNKSFSAVAHNRMVDDDAPSTQIPEVIAPEAGDVVVRKIRVGSFSTTDLYQQITKKNIDTLVLAGISTSGVVLSTVRDAADRDYRLYVLEDGCFDPDAEVHAVLTQKVFPRQAYVIKIADLPNLLEAS